MRIGVISYCLAVVVLCSCNKQEKIDKTPDTSKGTYFSIRDFAFDQWKTYHGQPYGIEKVVYLNGRKDSMLTNADKVDWAAVFRIFLESDISDAKFLDKYTFSQFADETTMTENFYYEANDKSLFTQKLHIIADINSRKISTIYIETAKNSKWGARTQRLFYEPVKSIIIQEFESTATGDKKDVRIEYRFL